ncbi:hypothetical protein F5050DRAFT_1745390 [Lentinula boryana]|uniref:Uncharacterized protein n=1 Tax=Lentinula boryana TaxID=40481 RepID=A0ABQ8QII3_9AGAR|nr:hypothetical protein F5050DRAFT_1745390 [Lentinula boryana]
MPKNSERDVGTKSRQSKRKDNVQDFHESPRRYPKKIQELVEANSGAGKFGGWKMSSEQQEPTGSSEGREGELRFESPSPSISLQQVEHISTNSSGMEHNAPQSTPRATVSETISSTCLGWPLIDAESPPANLRESESRTRPYHNSSYSDNSEEYAGGNSNFLQASQSSGRILQHRHRSFPASHATRTSTFARNPRQSLFRDPPSRRSTEMRHYSDAHMRESSMCTVDYSTTYKAPSVDRMPFSNPNQYTHNAPTTNTLTNYPSNDLAQELSPLEDFRPLQPDFECNTDTEYQKQLSEMNFGSPFGNFAHHSTGYGHASYYTTAYRETEVAVLEEFWRKVSGDMATSTATAKPELFSSQNDEHGAWQQPTWTQDNLAPYGQSTTASSLEPHAISMEVENGISPDMAPTQHSHDVAVYSFNQGSEYPCNGQYDHGVLPEPQQTYVAHFFSPVLDNELDPSLLSGSLYHHYPSFNSSAHCVVLVKGVVDVSSLFFGDGMPVYDNSY